MLTNLLAMTSLCSNNDHMCTLLSSNDNLWSVTFIWMNVLVIGGVTNRCETQTIHPSNRTMKNEEERYFKGTCSVNVRAYTFLTSRKVRDDAQFKKIQMCSVVNSFMWGCSSSYIIQCRGSSGLLFTSAGACLMLEYQTHCILFCCPETWRIMTSVFLMSSRKREVYLLRC